MLIQYDETYSLESSFEKFVSISNLKICVFRLLTLLRYNWFHIMAKHTIVLMDFCCCTRHADI